MDLKVKKKALEAFLLSENRKEVSSIQIDLNPRMQSNLGSTLSNMTIISYWTTSTGST